MPQTGEEQSCVCHVYSQAKQLCWCNAGSGVPTGAPLHVPEAPAFSRASGRLIAVAALLIHLLSFADAEGRPDLERPSTAPARTLSPSRMVRGLNAGSGAHAPTYKCTSALPCACQLAWAAAVLCSGHLCTLDTAVPLDQSLMHNRVLPCRACKLHLACRLGMRACGMARGSTMCQSIGSAKPDRCLHRMPQVGPSQGDMTHVHTRAHRLVARHTSLVFSWAGRFCAQVEHPAVWQHLSSATAGAVNWLCPRTSTDTCCSYHGLPS